MREIRYKNINLLYAYEVDRKKRKSWYNLMVVPLLIEIIIFSVVSVCFMFSSANVKRENAKIQSAIDSFESMQKEITEYNRIQTTYKQKKYVLDEIYKKNDAVLNTMTTLEEIMPSEMSIESISINSKGTASFIVNYKNESSLTELLNRMQSSECFENIGLDGISANGNTKRTSINCTQTR